MRYFLIISYFLFFSISDDRRVSAIQDLQLNFEESYEVGETINSVFQTSNKALLLSLHYSYGTTIISVTTENGKSEFLIPSFISEKSGVVSWKLISEKATVQTGTFVITPKQQPKLIETYFGPRSIQAGDGDYSMLVAIPTDSFDNPTPDSTLVNISEYYLGDLQQNEVFTDLLFSWKNVYSKRTSAKILVGVESKNIQTKELVSFVYPSTAVNFEIQANREHNYADGNQVATLSSKIIKDEFGNVVSDGTMVNFNIINSSGVILESSAGSINGVATVKVLHPDHVEKWNIQANVTGMAESDVLQLDFEAVLNEIPVQMDQQKNMIKVGPLKSFMDQLIPDGAEVVLKIINSEGKMQERLLSTSINGYVEFDLNNQEFKAETYTFKILTLGASKSIQVTY